MTCTAADVVGILSGRGAGNSGLNSDAQLLVREGLARQHHIPVIACMTPNDSLHRGIIPSGPPLGEWAASQ